MKHHLCVVFLVQVLLSAVPVSGHSCPAEKGVCVDERFCRNVTKGGAGYRGCLTSHGKYGVCCSKLNAICRRKGGPWYDCEPVKSSKTENERKAKDKTGYPACRTPDHHEGRCVPLKRCDLLYDRYLKKHHKKSRGFLEFLLKSKCQLNVPGSSSVCCRDPLNPEGFVKHWRARQLGLDQCGTVPFGGKILEGHEAGLGQYPWMANLMYYVRKRKTSLCSGSLIHPLYVLTAAHCFMSRLKPISVRLGEYDFSTKIDCEDGVCAEPYKESHIADWIAHEHFHRTRRSHDIALVRLYSPVTLVPRQIYPICLPLTEQMVMMKPSQLTVTGWGLTEEQTFSKVLKEVSLQVMTDSEYCQDEGLMCTRGTNNEGHCRGDSGGPLMKVMPYNGTSRTVVFGVVSGGAEECNTKNTVPGISTMVGYHIKWILDNMKYA